MTTPTPPTTDSAASAERAAFEAWAKAYGRIHLEMEPPAVAIFGAMYVSPWTQEAWVGWQARASLAAAPAPEPREMTACPHDVPHRYACEVCDSPALASRAPAAPHVGESNFEGWFADYKPTGGDKQRARDAYAAGMADRAPAAPADTDNERAAFDAWFAAADHTNCDLWHAFIAGRASLKGPKA